MKNLVAIISPSGKFYGSEQTLFNYLKDTSLSFDVYVKKEKGGLLEVVKCHKRHKIRGFKNEKLFYGILFFKILTKRYKKIYVNEGGHIRYIHLLSKFFRNVNFVVHIRLTEDAHFKRLKYATSSNIVIISVSQYISTLVSNEIGINTLVISSPLRDKVCDKQWGNYIESGDELKIGVIGRVTPSKGLSNLLDFVQFVNHKNITGLRIEMFGSIEIDEPEVRAFMNYVRQQSTITVNFNGFVKNKKEIFQNIDVVVHFNENEPHGVIFLESILNYVPFIGFQSGGIGEIGKNIQLNTLIKKNNEWQTALLGKLFTLDKFDFAKSRKLMLTKYSNTVYCSKLDQLLTV